MQFGLIKGKGTADTIFIVTQMQHKFGIKGKMLYFGFVYFEKAFDGAPRDVIRCAMRKLGVSNGWYRQLCLCTQVQKQLSKQSLVTAVVLRLKLVCTKVQH